jgi:hypothetical protein
MYSADFAIRRDCVVRLNPQLARRAARLITPGDSLRFAKEVASGRLDAALDRPVAVIQSPGAGGRFAQTADIPDSLSGQVKLTKTRDLTANLGASFA